MKGWVRESVCCLAGAFPADFPLTCSGGVFWLAGCLTPRTNEGTRARDSGTLPGERDDDGTLKTDLLRAIFTLSLKSAIATLASGRGGGEEGGHCIGLDIPEHESISGTTSRVASVKVTKRILDLELVLA